MTIKTQYDIGDTVFALEENASKGGFVVAQFTVQSIVIEENEDTEIGYNIKTILCPMKGKITQEFFDKDIYRNEEEFDSAMQGLWKNRK